MNMFQDNTGFCIYVNASDSSIIVKKVEDEVFFNVLREENNDIYYGPYGFNEAESKAHLLANNYSLYHNHCKNLKVLIDVQILMKGE